jgi:hypothetical protein
MRSCSKIQTFKLTSNDLTLKIENTIFLELGLYYRGYYRCTVAATAIPGVLQAYEWFRFRRPIPLSYTHVGFLIIQRLATIFDHVDVALVRRLITAPSESSRLSGSAFAI